MQETQYKTDNEGQILHISASAEVLLGYKPKELLGTPLAELHLDANNYKKSLDTLNKENGSIRDFEAPFKHKNGATVWVSINAKYWQDKTGAIGGIKGTMRNITERKLTEEKMLTLSSALEQTADMVLITDFQGIIEYVNPAFEQSTGYHRDKLIGKKPSIIKSGKQGDNFYKNLWDTILKGQAFSDVFINKRKNGNLFYEEKTITPLKDTQGKITHFVATGKDISERMQIQERLRFMAHHDALTELPNRTLYLDRLKHSLARARWHNRLVAVIFLDIDRFKNINDTLGHHAGDQLLIQITKRLNQSIREGDTIARFGGDEFAIMLDDISSTKDISILAQKILDTLVPAFIIDNRELFITASIGVSIYPEDGEDSDILLRNADIAMYRAKDLGKNNYQFYSSDMSARAFERMALESNLRHALERDEFLLHYQPQIDARDGQIIGVEALLRWQHPELGLVSPVNFVPLLEETGMIVEVGKWVLQNACQQANAWHKAGWETLKISTNLSGRQFNDPNFVDSVQNIIHKTGVNPKFLELEITESMLMRNTSATIAALGTLNKMGVRFAIDDFGTGYSSLTYLRRFPITTLKIDRSFIRDVVKDQDDAAITSAIIVMAHSLKLRVIAEGVETKQQLEFLQANDCHFIQGYVFSPPTTADEITQQLTRQTENQRITEEV